MPRDVVATLDSMISERSLLKHPFYQAWTAGTLSRERLQNYAVEYYPHVAAFPRYLSAIHSRCADIATRQALLEELDRGRARRGEPSRAVAALRRGDRRPARARASIRPRQRRASGLVDEFTELAKAVMSRAGSPRCTPTNRKFRRWRLRKSTVSSDFTASLTSADSVSSQCMRRPTYGMRERAPT